MAQRCACSIQNVPGPVSYYIESIVLEGSKASFGYKNSPPKFHAHFEFQSFLLIHRSMSRRELTAPGIHGARRRLPHAGVRIVHSHGLAAQDDPLLALALQRILNLHSRLASLKPKFHLRSGMIAVD